VTLPIVDHILTTMATKEALLLSRVRALAASGEAREIRRRAKLTQAEVGDACRVADATISRWEKGLRAPRGQAALRYARLLVELREDSGHAKA
jgi:DNA-binding transcriptional regulator YiaG